MDCNCNYPGCRRYCGAAPADKAPEAAQKLWHCYSTEHRAGGGVNFRVENVEAPTAEEAAAKAAAEARHAGPWTVIEGTPVQLAVREIKTYSARKV